MKPAEDATTLHPLRWRTEWALCALLLLPAVLLATPVRELMEASMALQMLIEFPLLVASGFSASVLLARRHHEGLFVEAVMRMGLAPLLGTSLCLMFWMVPLALDLARLDAGVNAFKYGSLILAGVALQHGLRRAPAAVLLFFGGNLVWTLATVGMLFQDAQSRLCANYLLADQHLAGTGLLLYAVAFAIGLALHLYRLPGYGFSSPPRGMR